jgi:hypothetical protein
VNGHRHKDIASDIALTPEKVRWTVWESEFARERGAPPGRPVEAPIDAIRNVTVCQASCRGKGALEGAGFGLLAGVIVGALAETACHGELCGLWLVTGPILVVPVGALLGLAFGHRTIIEVEPVAKR